MQARDALGLLFLIVQGMVEARASQPCIPKFLGQNAMVCVCNATYCDTLDPLSLPDVGTFLKYTTSRAGQRLERSEGNISPDKGASGGSFYTYNPHVQYQCIKGFGGSHTDAAAINILKLSPEAQNHLLQSYFSEEGIEYNLLRFPIACSDFSTRPYSYDDSCVDDFELKCFKLAPEDTKFRIPLLHRFMAISKRPLSLVASPWTSPAWLRVNNEVKGKSRIKGEAGDRYHKTWAQYFIRFLDEYSKNNITFWALTSQNEPDVAIFVPREDFPNNRFSAEEQRDFIMKDLGPALAASPHQNVHLIILDGLRLSLPAWANVVIGNSSSAKYVSGIGIHWYSDFIVPPGPTLEATHHLYPNFFLLYTESCSEYAGFEKLVDLGSWKRGVCYSESILTDLWKSGCVNSFKNYALRDAVSEYACLGHMVAIGAALEELKDQVRNLNHFVTGWIDWNMALDMEGGPNWLDNFLDSPIIVNPLKDEFYKQPMFYHLGHFSKFIPEGSVRVALTSSCLIENCQLKSSAFLRPDGTAVVVVLNDWFFDVTFTIWDDQVGYINDCARAYSIQTYLWRRDR